MAEETRQAEAQAAVDDALGLTPEEPASQSETQQSPDQGMSPGELPEDYKPYSQFPWEELPEEARPRFLEALKQFHGDMTKGQQEAAQLKEQLAEYKQKAEWFDLLTEQPWFQKAYAEHVGGGGSSTGTSDATPASSEDSAIAADLDPDSRKALQALLERQVKPLQDRIQILERQLVQQKTEAELAKLRQLAAERGWPSPDDLVEEMAQAIRQGRAYSPIDAYKLVAFDRLPEQVEKRAKQKLQEELERKRQQLSGISSKPGPSQAPGEEVYDGPDAVIKALRASMREIAAEQGR